MTEQEQVPDTTDASDDQYFEALADGNNTDKFHMKQEADTTAGEQAADDNAEETRADKADEPTSEQADNNSTPSPAKAAEEVKDYEALLAKAQNSLKQEAGRQSRLAKENNKLKKELESLRNKTATDSPLKDLYPEVHEEMEAMRARLQEQEEQLRQQQSVQHESTAIAEIARKYPDFDKVVQSAEFGEWVSTLPPQMRDWALDTDEPADVVFLLELYQGSAGGSKPVASKDTSRLERNATPETQTTTTSKEAPQQSEEDYFDSLATKWAT